MAAKQQHYVPRFLLKNFARGEQSQVYVYDKSNDKRFRTNIKNVAAEAGFYDLEVDAGVLTLEPALAHLEANTSTIIRKVVETKTLRILNTNDVAIVAAFLAVQFVRTKEHRLRFEHLTELVKDKLQKMGASGENIRELTTSRDDLPEDKLIGMRSIVDAKELMPHFLNKTWVLYETTPAHPFYISDNPIVLHNELDHSPYGNLGLAVRGIEIYLPFSSTLCLGLLCPSIATEFQKGYEKLKAMDRTAPSLADSLMAHPEVTRAFCEGLATGSPIKIVEDNVIMMNSLQVIYSSRFVYCELDAFSLVERMINDNEKYRRALRPSVS